ARAEILRWQYWDNPFAAPVSWVWQDGGRIVAHYCGMPVPILFAGRAAVGAVGVDAATAPSHRGQGLFERLARAGYDDGGRHGVRRDEAWWRWRYAERPGPPYRYFEVRDADRLQGAAAAVVREDFGGRFVFLLELLAADRWAARSVLAAVAEQTVGDASGVA